MKILPFLILPTIGLLIGLFMATPDNSQNENNLVLQEDSQKFYLAKTKLEKFTESQMNEYHALLDQQEKYKKADEILSKVMLIFLADLGLHLSQKNKSWVKEHRSSKVMGPLKKLIKTPEIKNTIEKDEDHDRTEIEHENVIYDYDVEPDDKDDKDEKRLFFKNKAKKFRRFYDLLGRNIKGMIPKDSGFNILSSNKLYKGETKPANKNLVNFYLGKKVGYLRRELKSNLKMTYKLKLEKNTTTDSYYVKLRLNAIGDSYTAIQINDTFTAVHPASHNSSGRGPCRTLILKGLNGLQIYLTFIKRQSKIFGRIVNIHRKRPTIGYFLLEKVLP
jgi:hypothetical protein